MRHAMVLFAAISVLVPATVRAGEATNGTPVAFKASDDTELTGILYGKGTTALVLCHGRAYTKGAASFADEARWLASKGLMVLALNFRGYPADDPTDTFEGQELDVAAAFDHVAKLGAKRIYLLGSSMGGFAALKALPALDTKPQYAGIIVLSAFARLVAGDEPGRKLFVVARNDWQFYPKTMVTLIRIGAPKQAIVFKKGGHGQQLFKSHRKELLEAIRLFVTTGDEASK